MFQSDIYSAEQVDSSGEASEMHSEDNRFESRQGHRLFRLGGFLDLPSFLHADFGRVSQITPRPFPCTFFQINFSLSYSLKLSDSLISKSVVK